MERAPAGSTIALACGRGSLLLVLPVHVHEPDQWQAQKEALVRRRAPLFLRSDGVTANEARATWCEPVEDASTCLAELVVAAGPGCRVAVLPEGPQSIAYLA